MLLGESKGSTRFFSVSDTIWNDVWNLLGTKIVDGIWVCISNGVELNRHQAKIRRL